MKHGIVSVTIIVIILTALSWRLKIQRDISQEKDMDNPQIAESYNQYSRSLILRLERKLAINELLKHSLGGILLDAGCGPGHLDMAVLKVRPELRIIGVDTSEVMLQIASRSFIGSRHWKRISFCKGNVQELPINNNSVEFVISTGSLHHWLEPGKALGEIYRILKPGGRFLLFDLRRDIPAFLYPLIWLFQKYIMPEAIRRGNGAIGSIWSSFTPAELENILSASLFRNWNLKQSWGWIYIRGKKDDV